jgi:hypothetical protein
MDAEDTLRKRIRRILSLADVGGSQAQVSPREVADQIMSMFSEYRDAPKNKRAAIYAKTKEEILKSLGKRADAAKGSSRSLVVSKGER